MSTTDDSKMARPRYVADKRATLAESTVLTRYLAHFKYENMIRTESIWFARLVNFRDSDSDEGRIATDHYLADIKHQGSDGADAPTQRMLYRRFLEQGPHQQAYASCWYIGEIESGRMWQEYVPNGEGVAVQTTVGQLLQQFNGTDRTKQVTLAPIEYVD